MLLPDYMNYFSATYSPEFVDCIVKVERSLEVINYDRHRDIIDNIFITEGTQELRTLCDMAIEVYRTNIGLAAQMQGFTLTNVDEHAFSILSNILMGISVLSKTDVLTITEGVKIAEYESDLEWVCKLLSITSTIPDTELLFYIEDVNSYVIDLLQAGENIEEYKVVNSKKFQQRFMNKTDGDRTGLVINVIRVINHFGYNPNIVLKEIENSLEEMTDITAIRKELLYLVAGSNLNSVNEIETFLDQAINSIFHNTQMILKLNSQWPNFEDWIK